MKSQCKAVLKSGKIIYVGFKVCHLNLDLGYHLKELNKKEWNTFDEKEYSFRKSIAGKETNYGDFCCKDNSNLWEKVIKLLSSIFYKHKTFLCKKKINEPWSTQFIKFCCRIVKSFPIDPDINQTVNKTTIEFLEKQLFLITKSIRSYFSINQNANSNNITVYLERSYLISG